MNFVQMSRSVRAFLLKISKSNPHLAACRTDFGGIRSWKLTRVRRPSEESHILPYFIQDF
jgi:hypothetical protein